MVKFCKEFPVLVTGNSKGVVDVYRLKNLNQELLTKDEHKKRLESAVYTSDKAGNRKGEDEEEELEGIVD